MFARVASEAVKAARAVPLKAGAAVVAAGVAGSGAAVLCEDALHTVRFPFSHNGNLSAYDHASIRRGFEVYRQVCATCHSIKYISFRNLVGVTHTAAEVKQLAKEYEVEDGPNDEGEMFERTAKPSDRIPGPYKNEQAGRAANNGAYPPDLSLMTKARENGASYVLSLLTGYMEPPVGKEMMEGLHYNPYFEGTSIAMPPPLMDGQIEYTDGTPATASQMAKDVATFLSWTAEPEHDDRKRMGLKWLGACVLATGLAMYYKRFRWAPLKTRKISYHD